MVVKEGSSERRRLSFTELAHGYDINGKMDLLVEPKVYQEIRRPHLRSPESMV